MRWGTWLLACLCSEWWLHARQSLPTSLRSCRARYAREACSRAAARRRCCPSDPAGIESEAERGETEAAGKRSQQIAAALRADPRFAFVANGDPAMFATSAIACSTPRYPLSHSGDAARFSVEGLRAAADDLEALLRSSAAPLIKADCRTRLDRGILNVCNALKPGRAPVSAHGVWFDSPVALRYCSRTTPCAGIRCRCAIRSGRTIRAAFGAALPTPPADRDNRHCNLYDRPERVRS